MDTVNADNELLDEWFQQMMKIGDPYTEPVLDEVSTSIIKTACDALNQDIHVFIMSIEILERYVRVKNQKQEIIEDKILVISAIILIASKYAGEQVDVKVSYINAFLIKFTGKTYNYKVVCLKEMEVLSSLNDILPITTKVDDLNTFVEKYVRDRQLRANVRGLCLHILEILYMLKMKWFFELKSIYEQNPEALEVFEKLTSSKFYLPIGILLCSLKLTKYKHFMKINSLTAEITKFTKIHSDHVNILCSKIMEIMSIYVP